ncbi:aminotransferase [Cohnella thailandensis]|uniref:Aminotransferase n=1 Tax=Cohnella thailandensis TaxID=557557 RepID=A0A841STM3_9BACL|nr:aminotransferase [Cohnella thailandensis]MBB6635673.1 aminotransferase [Cohnella thailandensis]MBP1976050.1 hypothetical protein [Cohnella thailandensis]
MDQSRREPPVRSWMNSPLSGIGPGAGPGGGFPGLGGETASSNALVGSPSPSELAGPPSPAFSPVQVIPPGAPAAAAPAKAGGLLGNFNINELKNIVERMGGIEGLISNMGKVQKFMSTVQQMAPLLKLFMGKKGSSNDDDVSSGAPYRPRRRRRRRRGSSRYGARRTGSGRRRRRSSAKRRR